MTFVFAHAWKRLWCMPTALLAVNETAKTRRIREAAAGEQDGAMTKVRSV